jgi:predicted O-methyltransferase YrrM
VVFDTFTVLEIGTYSGFSALAWYEGTRATAAEIVTLELSTEMIEVSTKLFKDLKVDDRIKIVEGPADKT